MNIVIFLNYDLLELDIQDNYKKPYYDCFFPFLTNTVVPTVKKQPPEVFFKNRCSQKFHRKTSVLESFW